MNGIPARARRQQTAPRRSVLAAVGCIAAAALVGCATSEGYGTANQVSSVNGAGGEIGPVAVRNALFAHPEQGRVHRVGSTVPLLVTISNIGDGPAELVGVRTPAARRVRLQGTTTIPAGSFVSSLNDPDTPPAPDRTATATPGTPAPSPAPTGTPPRNPSPSPTPGASPSPSPAPAASPSPSPAASPTDRPVEGGELRIRLTGLTTQLRPGLTYPVTFRFRGLGTLTLQVPLSRPGGTIGEAPREGGHGG